MLGREFSYQDTIVAIATPPGQGALGIIRVSGDQTLSALTPLFFFKSKITFPNVPVQKNLLADLKYKNQLIDQVLITYFKAPHSYTGEDLVEISCHGGAFTLKEILSVILDQGIRMAQAGEFTSRAFVNGKMDLTQAEAVCNLITAQTHLSKTVALRQLEGGLSRKLFPFRETLVEMLAHIEVQIDHTDDDTIGKTYTETVLQNQLTTLLSETTHLIESFKFGQKIMDGVRIAIIGRPNVGKSSLLNCLLKQERAIVTDIPGTTRDTLEEAFDLLGIPALLVDSAGIRNMSEDRVEKIGIERSETLLKQSDIVLIVLDGSQRFSSEDQDLIQRLTPEQKAVLLVNKQDLAQAFKLQMLKDLFPQFPVLSFSALENQGLDSLLETLYQLVLNSSPGDESFLYKGLVTSVRHRDCLVRFEQTLKEILEGVSQKKEDELIAFDVQRALDILGEITGQTTSEDILGAIFSGFCIGK